MEQPDVVPALLAAWKQLFIDWDDVLGILPFAAEQADEDGGNSRAHRRTGRRRGPERLGHQRRIRDELNRRGMASWRTSRQGVRWYRKNPQA